MSKSTSTKVKIFGTTIIVLISLLAITLTLELILRNNWRYARASYAYDENIIWRLRKNMKGERPYANWNVEGKPPFILNLNKDGFRGPDWEEEGTGKKRMMVVGDSYTAGLDYPREEIFTSIIERTLNETAQDEYEVMNASCPAWGTDQEVMYWLREGKKYQTDYLILMISPNDIRESFKKELVQLDEYDNLQFNTPTIPQDEQRKWKLANQYSIYQFLQKKVWDTSYGEFSRLSDFYQFSYGINDAEDWDYPIFLKDPPEDVIRSYALFEKLLIELNTKLKEQDTKLILCTIPIKTEIVGLKANDLYEPGKVSALVDSIARREKIYHVNLYDPLMSKEDPSYIYQHWEHHFNTDGHDFVAEEICRFLKQL